MKYLLISKQTGEQTLCDKVTIDGFDYYLDYSQSIKVGKWYISNQAPRLCVKIKECPYPYIHLNSKGEEIADFHTWRGIIICTNNPNLDIPQVVDEVFNLSFEYFASRDKIDTQSMYDFKNGYNKSQETHPFREEDMIEFAVFYQKHQGNSLEYWGKDLFKVWKEQKPKIVYYNE